MGSNYSVTRICLASGCTSRTHASKPYCHDHVEQNPHARWVARRLQEKSGALLAEDEAESAAEAMGAKAAG